ncbi:hypothetical protein HXX02_05740 [Microbulbifer elongatus]|uniref:Secreted protein n=1 Tax=Microbulbifer elongatus TaxID=86173 RepID=A0ABT1NYM6_9GAMM|nr:hypothetical protein [Microbulbifer elongatus]MCQ3828937.1 hypothetical protein [Microbulbifer elongatus]
MQFLLHTRHLLFLLMFFYRRTEVAILRIFLIWRGARGLIDVRPVVNLAEFSRFVKFSLLPKFTCITAYFYGFHRQLGLYDSLKRIGCAIFHKFPVETLTLTLVAQAQRRSVKEVRGEWDIAVTGGAVRGDSAALNRRLSDHLRRC